MCSIPAIPVQLPVHIPCIELFNTNNISAVSGISTMVSSSSPTRQQKLQTRLNDLLNGCSDDEFSVAEYLNSALYLHAYNNGE